MEILHGWAPEFLNCDAEFIVGYKGESAKLKLKTIVQRADQKSALNNFGFDNVVAIGSPFVYIENSFKKILNSAILMPVHSIQDKLDFNYLTWFYEQIKNMKLPISIKGFVLHRSTYEKVISVNGFEKLDIPINLGANPHDWKTFARLAEYFQKSDWVITNGIGSHVAYANLFGCKVYIIDPFAEIDYSHVKNIEFFKNIGEKRTKLFVDLYSKDNLKNHFPFLFQPFNKTSNHSDWAKKELGFDQKKTKEELIEIFGWSKKNSVKYFFINARTKVSLFVPKIVRNALRKLKTRTSS